MTRKRALIHLVGWPVLALFLIAASQGTAEPAGSPVYQRPVYKAPVARPKPSLPKLPVQLQVAEKGDDPNRVTQTVYGFLDFTTTIGNTVMVFTPQTKKADLAIVSAIAASPVEPVAKTVIAEPSSEDVSVSGSSRQAKEIAAEDPPLIESSEYEPQIFATSAAAPAAVGTTSLNLEYVDLASETLLRQSQEDKQDDSPKAVVVAEEKPETFFVTPEVKEKPVVVKASIPSKGFTLKFSKAAAPSAEPPKEITAEPALDQPTGIVDQIYDTRVNDGITTVVETKIIGTYIGKQYARILESTSSVLPVIAASQAPSLPPAISALKPKLAKPLQHFVVAEKVTTTTTTPKPEPSTEATSEQSSPEVHTAQSVSSSSGSDDFTDEDRYTEEQVDNDSDDFIEPSTSAHIEPTPTATEEQTLYVLPQKKDDKAELYVSPVPNNNAYSRQPQFAVDVSPAKSFDFIVTATPSNSRKPFRPSTGKSNRFNNNRFTNRGTSGSTESNEVASLEATTESNNNRANTRFRTRGRSGSKKEVEPEVAPSVYSKTIAATPAGRRFTTSTTSRRFSKFEKPVEQSHKTGRAFGHSAVSKYIEPTSSTSIYRFKLNRPTGRWRFKPSPKPKVNIIKTKEEEELSTQASGNIQQAAVAPLQQANGPVYYQSLGETGDIQQLEETRTESNELAGDIEPELVPQTLRVATVTPTEFEGLDKYVEIATIRSPYVFQAGNVKNTRYITLTKTFTKENIQPTQASVAEATLENILATRPPYEKILEGSSDVATLPVIVLSGDQMTPPLETVTQSFSTTQLMLKTSILPVLYDGVTTLYTLTQSYFVTRLVTAHKTVPPIELFQFVPTKSLTEFNTALQEAGSENREHLLASETEENDANFEHILAPPDELAKLGSDFDPSSMEEKILKASLAKAKSAAAVKASKAEGAGATPELPKELANLSPEQLAFLRYFNQQQQPQANSFFPPPLPMMSSQLQYSVTSSPIVFDTVTTIVESKTLRILFGAKPTSTVLYSTRVVPTKMTTYVTTTVPVKPTAAIPNFFQQGPFPFQAFVG